MSPPWHQLAGIDPPDLAVVARHPRANAFALLVFALLEHGGPMTLREVAARLEAIGVAVEEDALRALQRSRPARAPIYRDGDHYHLDPHDDELQLWIFKLDLRPGHTMSLERRPPPVIEVPGDGVPLTSDELDEAWKVARISGWSAQRLALAVLDANGGPLAPAAVIAAVLQRTGAHALLRGEGPKQFGRRGCAVAILADGRWAVADGADEAVAATRRAVRERVALARKYAAMGPDPAVMAAHAAAFERRRAAQRELLAGLRRGLVATFPASRPAAATFVDVSARTVRSFLPEQFDELLGELEACDIVGAVDVRAVLRCLAFDPGPRRLAELGPPQKTWKLNQHGRTLKITTELLIAGSCGIGRPFGERGALARHLEAAAVPKLLRRLEADAKALCALYEYGRLHGCVRLRWGFLDERLPAPWVHRDEATLHDLKKQSGDTGWPLEIVVGSAPGWSDPWSRAGRAYVERDASGWRTWIVDEQGDLVHEPDIQRARLVEPPPDAWT